MVLVLFSLVCSLPRSCFPDCFVSLNSKEHRWILCWKICHFYKVQIIHSPIYPLQVWDVSSSTRRDDHINFYKIIYCCSIHSSLLLLIYATRSGVFDNSLSSLLVLVHQTPSSVTGLYIFLKFFLPCN